MGGGRRFFLSENKTDPELNYTSYYQRKDLDLVDVIKIFHLISRIRKKNENESFLSIFIHNFCSAGVNHVICKGVQWHFTTLQIFMPLYGGLPVILLKFDWQEWLRRKQEENVTHSYVWNNMGFNAINPQTTDYVLGKIESSPQFSDILVYRNKYQCWLCCLLINVPLGNFTIVYETPNIINEGLQALGLYRAGMAVE